MAWEGGFVGVVAELYVEWINDAFLGDAGTCDFPREVQWTVIILKCLMKKKCGGVCVCVCVWGVGGVGCVCVCDSL